MKRMILAVLLMLIIPGVSAQVALPQEAPILCDLMKKQLEEASGPELPSFVPFSNEIINLYLGDSAVIGHIILKDKVLSSMECTEHEDATFIVHIENSQTLYDIQKGESRLKVLVEKLDSDEISVEGTTFGKKVSWFFAKAGMRIGSWFA